MLVGAVLVVPAISLGAGYGVKKLFDIAAKKGENPDNVTIHKKETRIEHGHKNRKK